MPRHPRDWTDVSPIKNKQRKNKERATEDLICLPWALDNVSLIPCQTCHCKKGRGKPQSYPFLVMRHRPTRMQLPPVARRCNRLAYRDARSRVEMSMHNPLESRRFVAHSLSHIACWEPAKHFPGRRCLQTNLREQYRKQTA